MIIKEIKVNSNKTTVSYHANNSDNCEMTSCFKGSLPPEIQNCVEQISNFVIETAKNSIEQDLNQGEFNIFGKEVARPEVKESGKDYSEVPIPIIEDTDIPDFSKMENAHIRYCIDICENLDSLKHAVAMNFGENLRAKDLEVAKEAAKQLIK